MSRYEKLREDGLAKIDHLESQGVNPYPPDIPPRSHTNLEITQNIDALLDQDVQAVGRILGLRKHGKRVFIDIADEFGTVQVMLSKGRLSDHDFTLIKESYSSGDFIAVDGVAIRTHMGEPTIDATNVMMLAKAVVPPPSLKSDLKDPEVRRRQRYLELMTDPNVRERFKIRSLLVRDMRRYFEDELGAWEVETPVLDTVYGGAHAKPFITHYNALNQDVFLRISNELYLKRLLTGGYEGVFEFSKDFRNEGMDRTHNPEFMQVELYVAYTDYNWMMDMMEQLMSEVVQNRLGASEVEYQGQTIDMKTPWRRLSIADGLREYANIDVDSMTDEAIIEEAGKHGIDEVDAGYATVALFEKYVEEHLVNPTFVIDYPSSTSPLTKPHRSKPGVSERFECFVAGMEVANCYTELNDPRIQRANFEEQVQRQKEGDQEAMPMDEDFITAMEYGMPPMGGIGISIDRWTMLLTDTPHIRDAMLFPTSRTQQKT